MHVCLGCEVGQHRGAVWRASRAARGTQALIGLARAIHLCVGRLGLVRHVEDLTQHGEHRHAEGHRREGHVPTTAPGRDGDLQRDR